MTRFWFALALPLALVFAAALLLIPAQPYDDSELRAFLLPADCPAPCFMGIRPGVTTVEEAIAMLEAHEWVDTVKDSTANPTDAILEWTWNGLQPTFINARYGLYLTGSIGGSVTSIRIPVTLPMIKLWWLFGQPILQIGNSPYGRGKWYSFAYPESGMMITSIELKNCIPLLKSLLNAINFAYFRSVENMRESSNNFQGFDAIPFDSFSNRKSC